MDMWAWIYVTNIKQKWEIKHSGKERKKSWKNKNKNKSKKKKNTIEKTLTNHCETGSRKIVAKTKKKKIQTKKKNAIEQEVIE